jgi:hypothetical protein
MVLWCAVVATANLCSKLQDLAGVNIPDMQQHGYNIDPTQSYFCGPGAPQQFLCDCGVSATCSPYFDPWGNNLGVCSCCPSWVYGTITVFVFMVTLAIAVGIYACVCRGKWWCDGYPEPIEPLLPRRGPPVVAPASAPLPPNLFRGYRITDFVSEAPEEPPEQTSNSTRRRAFSRRRDIGTSPGPPQSPPQQLPPAAAHGEHSGSSLSASEILP